MLNFAHSGGTGDILYGCYVIKKICEENNEICNVYLKRKNIFNNLIDIYNTLKKLLINQNYINDIILVEHKDDNFCNWDFNFDFYDLDKFRHFADNRSNLIDCHLKAFNKDNLIQNWKNESWIDINSDFNIKNSYIVINRTSRYRAKDGKNIWINSLKKYTNYKKYFIGLDSEYDDFYNEFNIEIEHYKVNDLYETSLIIKNAEKTLCNPSSILALCISMNLPYLVELDDQWDNVVKTNRNNEIIMT